MKNITDSLLLRTNQTLQLLATENSLVTILDDVIRAVESQIDESRGSILILDRPGKKLCSEAGPNLPEEFHIATKEFPIGLNSGACGKAAFTNESVIISDIKSDPACAPFADLANKINLNSAWSIPIRNVQGKVLGTFCVYCSECREPTDVEMAVMQSFANIAGIAIQKKRTDEKLRENEKRFKKMFNQIYSIMGDTSSFTGIRFIEELTKSLAVNLNFDYAFVGEFIDGERPSIKTLTFWNKNCFGKNFEYTIADTPCERVMNGQTTMLVKKDVQFLFPKDKDLETLGVECYGGVCLENENKENIGIFVVLDSNPMENSEYVHIILSVFASKVKAELNRIRIEEEMIQAKLESEKSNEAKSQFLARMSHELRTPLNAILGFSQLMKMESNLSASQEKSLAQISKAGKHLLALINEVLDLAKIDAGTVSLSLENIALSQIFSELISLFTPLARENSVEIKLVDELKSEVYVFADYLRLNQVLINLISNAVKYNRKDGKVFLSSSELPDSMIRIMVEDTGPGIEKEKLELVFHPFERLEHECSVVQGTGIGLTIARQLATQMNGELSAKSIVGEGSCFYIDIPKGERPKGITESPNEETLLSSIKAESGIKTILYIEDNLVNIELVEHILLPSEINLVSALDGEKGLKLAQERNPDLILLDIHLPGMDGVEVFKNLRQIEDLKKIPVYALTANAMSTDRQAILDAGFDGYFSKPLNLQNFLKAISQIINKE